jgi:hypothetical protein
MDYQSSILKCPSTKDLLCQRYLRGEVFSRDKKDSFLRKEDSFLRKEDGLPAK